ncbi:rhodanese-like domain-containing protein [Streptomyces clavuligerus]|uniref:Rhodanese domain-containing protein n=1 Tax=Streptomyces clavuligerus TaxID=1901 RepID=E2Q5Z7_STRCL|nr:rhodanese-like domain-containing protein [Streptomyces clavuligerus]ANW21661.1 transporter [Streptomyces clavuligerus]AXU16290.1 DUF2892 domain-containing protein [Streptomyces clavuligerus]EFG05157.1 Rhodanese domain-containing protein [Streptomyces clavuligerus]MBY6306449.1 rhodanese-like domain-containing protein [Streptomyces clavuligerus]QCS09069.1 DUF2892 domain-containing protein [Streptomyces clavuligerus]
MNSATPSTPSPGSTGVPELGADAAFARLAELTVVDVRTPGEYASGHLPGAHHVPLGDLDTALPALRVAAERGELLVVCASGARSAEACRRLAGNGVAATTLTGGTTGWVQRGHALHHPPAARAPWAMDRQVRLAAGSLVLTGLLAGRRRPVARVLSAGVAGGLVLSALTNTCTMARVLGKLPYNRAGRTDLEATLAALRG